MKEIKLDVIQFFTLKNQQMHTIYPLQLHDHSILDALIENSNRIAQTTS